MLKFSFLRCLLLALFFCLGTASVGAQAPQMMPPPPPDFSTAPPPDPNSVPPPPPLTWEALPQPPAGATNEPPQGPLVVPLPQDEPVLAPPSVPVKALFLSAPADPLLFQLATPWVEIWRNGATEAELMTETENGPARSLIATGNPILVSLHFDPSLTGTLVAIHASNGVELQPAVDTLIIGPGGECVLQVQLDNQNQGEITVHCQGVTTVLPLLNAPADIVEALVAP